MPPLKRKFVPSKEIKKLEIEVKDKNGNPSSSTVSTYLPCVCTRLGYK